MPLLREVDSCIAEVSSGICRSWNRDCFMRVMSKDRSPTNVAGATWPVRRGFHLAMPSWLGKDTMPVQLSGWVRDVSIIRFGPKLMLLSGRICRCITCGVCLHWRKGGL